MLSDVSKTDNNLVTFQRMTKCLPDVSKTDNNLATSSSDSFPSRSERWKDPEPIVPVRH